MQDNAQTSAEVTRLLLAWQEGDSHAFEKLMPLIFEELHRLAKQRFAAERAGHTLQPTALINEVYLRLMGDRQQPWRNRAHFFGEIAESMRRILIDHARRRAAAKRGCEAVAVAVEVVGEISDRAPVGTVDLLALDQALTKLGQRDARKSRIVELRYFAGLSLQEVAEVLDLSLRTVAREWSVAKAWLFHDLKPSAGHGD